MSAKVQIKRAQRLSKRSIWSLVKLINQYLFFNGNSDVVFILGCQRSGTTLIADILDRDINSKVFPEFSELSSDDHAFNIRLNSLPKVKKNLSRIKAALIVIRPLVESHRAQEILSTFEDATVIWVFRHYKDVVSSNLKKFGIDNGYKNLAPILERDSDDWRSQGLSEEVHDLVSYHSNKGLNPQEAQCLFWYVRNLCFFEKNLQKYKRVLPLKYEDFVETPLAHVKKIYAIAGLPCPDKDLVFDVHADSVKKKIEMNISSEILSLCDEMWRQLESLSNEVY